MTGQPVTDLRSLREQPFELLQEIERRSIAALAGTSVDSVNAAEWVGIGFRLIDEQFVVRRDSIREVLMVPDVITRVPGAKPWVRGLANVRGHLLPIIDLNFFLESGHYNGHRDARVLVIKDEDFQVGLIVDEVYGFRRFLDSEWSETVPQTLVQCDPFLDGIYERGVESWPVFSVERLGRSNAFRSAAA